jgi:hypothetical protein
MTQRSSPHCAASASNVAAEAEIPLDFCDLRDQTYKDARRSSDFGDYRLDQGSKEFRSAVIIYTSAATNQIKARD